MQLGSGFAAPSPLRPCRLPRALPKPGPARPRSPSRPAAVWPRTCQAHWPHVFLCHRTPPNLTNSTFQFLHVKNNVKIIDPGTYSPAARGRGAWVAEPAPGGRSLPLAIESGGVPACSAQALHVLRYCAGPGVGQQDPGAWAVGASRAIRHGHSPAGLLPLRGPWGLGRLSALVRDGPFLTTGLGQAV